MDGLSIMEENQKTDESFWFCMQNDMDVHADANFTFFFTQSASLFSFLSTSVVNFFDCSSGEKS